MQQFSRSGFTFDVSDDGPADGPVIVLLHGFPENRTSWAALTPLLLEAGFRVLAPDQRGYSPGARPTSRRSYAMPELVADALALVDAAGAPPPPVGGPGSGGGGSWAIASPPPH